MGVEFLKRSFLHPGKTKCEEQKREASEKYEERCEPSLNKLTGSRYCKRKEFSWFLLHSFLDTGPDIKTWQAFKNYEVGSGYRR